MNKTIKEIEALGWDFHLTKCRFEKGWITFTAMKTIDGKMIMLSTGCYDYDNLTKSVEELLKNCRKCTGYPPPV